MEIHCLAMNGKKANLNDRYEVHTKDNLIFIFSFKDVSMYHKVNDD